jgi:lysine-specific demethylase 8
VSGKACADAAQGVVQRVCCSGPEQFVTEHLRANVPVILEGVITNWPASGKWTPAWFAANYPDLEVPYERWSSTEDGDEDTIFSFERHAKRTHLPMAELVNALECEVGRAVYSTMFPVFDVLPQLSVDVRDMMPYQGLPAWWPAWLGRLFTMKPFMWTGGAGALTVLHFDRVHNLYVQFAGRKRWLLFPPAASRLLYWPCEQLPGALLQFSPVDAERPDLDRYPLFKAATPLVAEVGPGDVLFVPTGWWHQVRSLTLSLALNYFWAAPVATPLALREYGWRLARQTVAKVVWPLPGRRLGHD